MPCPICRKPVDPGYRPFCSKRCADLDLGRWLNNGYAIPAAEEDDPEAQEAALAARLEEERERDG